MIYAGNRLKISIQFLDADGNLSDPDTAVLAIGPADHSSPPTTVQLADLTRDGVGTYHYVADTTGNMPGTWVAQVTSTGRVAAVAVTEYVVERPPLA